MSKVVVRDGESLEEAMRRFKRQVGKANTLQECKKHEFFYNKALKRKMKSDEAKRKASKNKY